MFWGGTSYVRKKECLREKKAIQQTKEPDDPDLIPLPFGSFLSEAEAKEPEVTYYKYYANVEIQPGDTIWELADDYMDEQHYESREAYIREVQELNSLADTDSIVSGQYLILPYYSTEYKL